MPDLPILNKLIESHMDFRDMCLLCLPEVKSRSHRLGSVTPCIVIEIIIRNEVWFYICMYSPHSKHKMACCSSIDAIIDACQSKRPANIFVVGDLNINFLGENESRCLKDVMDVFALHNLIDTPTCY